MHRRVSSTHWMLTEDAGAVNSAIDGWLKGCAGEPPCPEQLSSGSVSVAAASAARGRAGDSEGGGLSVVAASAGGGSKKPGDSKKPGEWSHGVDEDDIDLDDISGTMAVRRLSPSCVASAHAPPSSRLRPQRTPFPSKAAEEPLSPPGAPPRARPSPPRLDPFSPPGAPPRAGTSGHVGRAAQV